MKTIRITIIITILTSITAISQIKKGYKSLEKMEYDRAKEAFEKVIEDDAKNSAANFGLAMVYYDDRNPGYNYLTAWRHMDIGMKNNASLSADDMEVMAEYFLNTEETKASWPVKKKMEREKKILEERLIKYVREKNDLEFINRILSDFPDYRYYKNVEHIRNYLEFRKAEKANTIEALDNFMKTYPDAAQIKKAIKLKHDLAFEKAKKYNTIHALNEYIIRYPDSYNKHEALKLRDQLAYNQAKAKNTVEAYEEFIKTYPDATQVLEAKKQQMLLYYLQAKAKNTYEAYTDFLTRYPEGREYVDIFNLKASILGKNYMHSCVNKPQQTEWIKAFDNQGNNDIPAGVVQSMDMSLVFAGSTPQENGKSNDAWVLKLDGNGNMQWNKYIGDEGEDIPLDVAVNKNGEILVAGYTNMSKNYEERQAWVFKLGADGKRIWNRSLGKTQANVVDVGSKDEVVVGGFCNDSINTSKLLLYKLKNDGKKLWRRDYTSTGQIYDLCVNKNDEIIVASGYWIFALDKDGYIIWETPHDNTRSAKAVCVDASGNAYLAGSKDNKDVWVAKYDGAGQMQWEKTIDHNGAFDEAYAIEALNSQTLIIGGKSGGDALVMKISTSGNIVSKYSFGNNGKDYVDCVANGMNGKALILSRSTNPGSREDIILMKGN